MESGRQVSIGVLILTVLLMVAVGIGVRRWIGSSMGSSSVTTAQVVGAGATSEVLLNDVAVPTRISTEQWMAHLAQVKADRTAAAMAHPRASQPLVMFATATAQYALPLSESNAKEIALQAVQGSTDPRETIAKLVSKETLQDVLGWGLPPDESSALVWLVAVKTTGMTSDFLGRQAGFDPPSGMTPEPVDGYVIAISERGVPLVRGSLQPESSESNQRYSVISAISNESR